MLTTMQHRSVSFNVLLIIDVFCLSDRDLHIDRSRVTLEELLGDGQFGNVYKGVYNSDVCHRHRLVLV